MKRLRVVFVCLTLQIGVLAGVPMRPDDIRELDLNLLSVRPACETGAADCRGRLEVITAVRNVMT